MISLTAKEARAKVEEAKKNNVDQFLWKCQTRIEHNISKGRYGTNIDWRYCDDGALTNDMISTIILFFEERGFEIEFCKCEYVQNYFSISWKDK